jgi:hypothetical protein
MQSSLNIRLSQTYTGDQAVAIPLKHQALVKYAEDQAVVIPLKHQALVNLYRRSGSHDPT